MKKQSTCDKLSFVTNLENYNVFVAKFDTMVNTLVNVYEQVDNGIANCMSLIIISNDPKFEHFNKEQKDRLIKATIRKLDDIYRYLQTDDINPIVYSDLEVIVDMSCYLNDETIKALIDNIDKLEDNQIADIFIVKYKIINNMEISEEKLKSLKQNEERVWQLYKVMENLGVNDKYLKDISQEQIAKSDMIRWLSYPTELGSRPDTIELLGSFNYNGTKCFAYKFSKKDFKIKGDLLGISGGFPIDRVTANSCGYTLDLPLSPTKDSTIGTCLLMCFGVALTMYIANATFSYTVLSGKSLKSWKTTPMLLRR